MAKSSSEMAGNKSAGVVKFNSIFIVYFKDINYG
jgi:hypothetical protein